MGALWEGYAPEDVGRICEIAAETIQIGRRQRGVGHFRRHRRAPGNGAVI